MIATKASKIALRLILSPKQIAMGMTALLTKAIVEFCSNNVQINKAIAIVPGMFNSSGGMRYPMRP